MPPFLIESRTSFEPSKPTTITSFRPAASSAAQAPIAMVSLPEITPLMSGLACRIDSIFSKASVWLQLADCCATIFRSGYSSITSW